MCEQQEIWKEDRDFRPGFVPPGLALWASAVVLLGP